MSERQLLKRYLLGSLTSEERINVETRYLSNAVEFEELTEVENDLFDSYARGTLSKAERSEFELRYLGSQRVRIDFAHALAKISREDDQVALIEKPSLWTGFVSGDRLNWLNLRWAVGAVSVVAFTVVLGSLHWMNHREMQARLHEPNVGPGLDRPPAIAGPSNHQAPQGGGAVGTEVAKNDVPKLTEFTVRLDPGVSGGLTPGVSRGLSPSVSRGEKANSKVFIVPSGVSHITLQLRLSNDEYRDFIAEVETSEGTKVARIEALRKILVRGEPTVLVRLPSFLFPSGNYVAKLNGIAHGASAEEGVEKYGFTIIR